VFCLKLVTFIFNDSNRFGVKTNQGIMDVEEALQLLPTTGVPTDVHQVIDGGKVAVEVLQTYVDKFLRSPFVNSSQVMIDETKITYAPCVTRPNKIICVGLNYRKHAEETNSPIPQYPILFNKFNNTLNGHGQDVELPRASVKVDYEVELALVIGKKTKYVTRENALDHVFGYCNVNDISARDLQLRTQQWLLGKTCDGFSPLGPYLVTADEVGNPNQLELKCTVNGEVRQHSNTSDMIFPCDEIISYISQHFTLEPGDVILTGTPEGVVIGYPVEKQVYLKHGDIVTIEVEKLGTLTNRFVTERN
jgi:2-keto-4-pentenoate hydratase/2-oxohepta-3-ene-1,7-dioic acid hydratase in catechol pathway